MRRNFCLLFKWFLFIGISVKLFELSCDTLVKLFLSSSSSSIVNMKDSDSDITYEDSLMIWAATGQRFKNEKHSIEDIQQKNDLQLIGAQIFFRHGARTPINLLPSLEEVYFIDRILFHKLICVFFSGYL